MGLDWLWAGQNIPRLAQGLWLTAQIAFISVALSAVFGTGLGLLMRSKSRMLRWLCRLYLETIRIVPILLWLFVLHFGFSTWTGIHIDGLWVCIWVFTLWGTAEVGDLLRAALGSIERHQRESAQALGLSARQVFFFIEAPQALRRVLPGMINLFTRMVKTTSLAALIGVIEIIKVGQQLIENSLLSAKHSGALADSGLSGVVNASLWVYGLIFILYFLICYPLSLWASRLEKRWES